MITSVVAVWEGYLSRGDLDPNALARRDALADAARDARWPAVLDAVATSPDIVNAVRPGGRSGFTPLHQAAFHGDEAAARDLLAHGAWPSLRSDDGERPSDVARRRDAPALADLLQPARVVTDADVLEIYLHAVLQVECRHFERQPSRRPAVEVLADLPDGTLYFPITGMFGGASIRWAGRELRVEFSSRMDDAVTAYVVGVTGVARTRAS